ncbi:activating signal cointegrator 1 complex subunit 3-like [Xyrauchen texanus]|uniref:activating signal cointegrator 1 complex subunit 3-like n=1 Tax=Xyrauchen texanus TaxID=154827 RepID=UPI0022429737|nr:activating signal cointegrator 1 complex subunit 3-like [Xyrauchen texanus]XP_052002365.1 activating signal cointegrator 1 complex subunit 3-like [Xyrauchen texanus]XP_052002368.1 activating signal cointegrator 1 complex subunit 3-like [Xyrauchen texanus]
MLAFVMVMLDVVSNEDWLVSTLGICNLVQMIIQGRCVQDSSLFTFPHIEKQDFYIFRRWSFKEAWGGGGFQGPIAGLPELITTCHGKEENFTLMVKEVIQPNQISQVCLLYMRSFQIKQSLHVSISIE